MNEFKLGTNVMIMGNPRLTGEIVGTAVETYRADTINLFLIELLDGFFNPEQTMFVRIIVAHPDSLKEII